MKKNDTLLLAVVYSGVEQFLPEYFHAVSNQDTEQFDLLVVLDGFERENLPNVSVNVNIVSAEAGDKPAAIRLKAIRYALENSYKNIIFSDCDDFFTENRISSSIMELSNSDFVFNELDLIDGEGNIIGEKLLSKLHGQVLSPTYKDLLDYNIFGLTHTGIKLTNYNSFMSFATDVIAFDWLFYTILLFQGFSGKFIPNATTFYRQTADNTVGMQKLLDKKRLLRGIEVKNAHYNNVLDYCRKHGLEFAVDDYSAKIEEMKELKSSLEDSSFRDRYITSINANFDHIYRGWWSEILPLSHWRGYAD